MELTFHKKPCDCLRQVVREVRNEEQTQEIKLPDAMPDIGRILGAWGQCVVRGKEWRSSGMHISGGVMAWVLYAPEDGSEPRAVESWIPFQMHWDFPETRRDGTMRISCALQSMDARSLSARKMMVRAAVSALGEAMEPTQVDISLPEEVPEDVQLLKKTYPLLMPREAGEKVFQMDEDLSLPGSCQPLDKILSYRLQPELIDQKLMAGRAVFRGMGLLHLMYLGQDGKLHTWDFELPFSQYTELDREYDQDAMVRVYPAITSLELEADEGGHLRMKAGLTGQYTVYARTMVEVAEDAYSNRRPVTVQRQQAQLPAVLDMCSQTFRVQQTVDTPGQPVEAMFYGGQPQLRREPEGTAVDMDGTFQLLYYDEAGEPQSSSGRWNEEWQIPMEQGRVNASVWPSGKAQTGSGGAMTVSADMTGEGIVMSEEGIPMVTGLTLGDMAEPDPARPSLVLRRAGEQGLWELAKSNGSTVEAIKNANRLSEEPEMGRMLLIPIA